MIIYVAAAMFFFFLPFLLTACVKQRSLYGQRLLGPYTRLAALGLIANVAFACGAWYLARNTG